MSLIDEALRRARQEAALQDSAKREAQYRQVPVYAPPQPRRAAPTLIAAAVAACVIAGIGIGVFLGRGGGQKPEGEPTVQAIAEAPAPPQVVPQESVEIPEETARPSPTPGPARETPSGSQQVAAATAEPLQPPPALDVSPTPAPAAAEPVILAPETPAPPAPQAPPEPSPAEIRTYVREVPLPDGGMLRLSGIAFSAAQPVALINDKVLAKGESYQGFLVADIQANLVELRGNGMTFRVTLK